MPETRDTERMAVPLELEDTAVAPRPAPPRAPSPTDLVIVARRAATEQDWPPAPPAPARALVRSSPRRASLYPIPVVTDAD